MVELDDTQGGTTGEGIHLGARAGTVDILTRAFAGMHMDVHELTCDPRMPRGAQGLSFRVRCHGHGVGVTLDGTRNRAEDCVVWVNVAGVKQTLRAPGPRRISVDPGRADQ